MTGGYAGHSANSGRKRTTTVGGSRWTILVVGLVMLLLIIAQGVATGFTGLLGSAGLIALCTGLYTVLTNRPSWLDLPNRVLGGILAVAGLLASVIATAIHWG
ncbi:MULTISPECIES: hypothetical protein [unclassified Arthrobacter]|uniref:hypothetical protein n=1 Tax=unclassified Arthrobacter TaxID=235627 RepID=UPI002107BD0B|nr:MULTISPECIES: hypothetical protein [unclassified Arthrobacter]MCQ1947530.1 hypothetical protein [Arthrobacter sp. zg-Y1116]MCQ1987482.1 hypothetical protein [Arthrobacter sp. zg-Y844]MCQ1996826.1 hypothetical protein [Arthrobacter sp. zg-Y1171]UWX82419.1 hypothetical protein N2L00_03005 [Arthrobacter sp. zg-Y1171]